MGQKTHPVGFRLGIIRDWESKWFLDRGYSDALAEDWHIRSFIHKNLKNAAISRVEIERRGNQVKVTIYTAKPGIIIGRGGKGVDDIRALLERLTGKMVHVNVEEIRYPDRDAQLVAETIAAQIEKRIAYKRAMRQAMMRALRLDVKGIKINCAGRLAGSEMARREVAKDGKIPLHTLRADIDYGFAEAATTYGHIGIKVWIYKGDVLPGKERSDESELKLRREVRTERGDRGGERGRRGRGSRGGRTNRHAAGPETGG